MLDFALIRTRLSQYGVAWLAGFAAALLAILGGAWLGRLPIVRMADLALPPLLALLAVLVLAAIAATLLDGRRTVATRLVVILLAVLLALPLLWAPVLGAVGAAWIGDVSIEYSTAYAQFRIRVSQALAGLAGLAFDNLGLDTVWALFQGLATIVGFFSAFFQVWPRLLRLLGAREAQA